MKFFTSNINLLISKFQKGEIKALLLYGSNQGLKSKITDIISKEIGLSRRFITIDSITYEELKIVANNKNFFNQRELIQISDTKNLNSKFTNLISISDFYHLPCFIGNEITKQTRKFFESNSQVGIIACYYDKQDFIDKLIAYKSKIYNKNIPSDAISYFKSNILGDRNIIESELEKLFAYTGDQDSITKNDVMKTLSICNTPNWEQMFIYFAEKNKSEFLREAKIIIDSGKNEISIIRTILKYYSNIYSALLEIRNGKRLDNAISSMNIFFKYSDKFKRILSNNKPSEIKNILFRLNDAEISYKNNPKGFNLYNLIIE